MKRCNNVGKLAVNSFLLIMLSIINNNVYAESNTKLSAYTNNIRQIIIDNIKYPQQIQPEAEGKIVRLAFTMNKEGKLEEARIIKSSGFPVIDEAILGSVYKAGPFPSPEQIGRNSLQMALSFKLISRSSPQEPKNSVKAYRNWVNQKVRKVSFYPLIAKVHKWEGIVILNVKINSSGTVEEVKVAKSSGYPLLDKAAKEAVYRASPYPFPYSIKNTPSLTLTIPFNFYLEKTSVPSGPPGNAQVKGMIKTFNKPTSPLESYVYRVREKIAQEAAILPSQEALTKEYIKENSSNKAVTSPFIKMTSNMKPLYKETTVRFTINNRGSVENLAINKSSGSSAIDKAAKEAVYSAQPFLSPLSIGRHSIQLSLPIEFNLRPPMPTSTGETSLQKPSNKQEGNSSQHKKIKKPRVNTFPEKEESAYIPEGKGELRNLVRTAIQNSKPLEIVSEEMKLANIKLTEAKRNLWPSTTLGFYHTKGETYNLDYREQEEKITVNQPLYYGGQLTNAIKQADVNIEINRRNYLEKKIDVINKTEVAYFNLIALYQNMEKQKEIVDKAQKILQIVDKQYKNGLVIKLDYNEAHSWHKQLTLQLKSIKQEKDLARLSLKQALNTGTIPQLTNFSIGIKEFNFTLDECVHIALKYRPEMELGKLMVKFYDYARKVEEGKEKFRVDMTGSYGYYQGGYETESLKPASNWSIGIKVTKPWGPNTLTNAYNTNNQQPRFGETSPTKTSTLSTELKVFDNYKMKTNLENAKIMYLKSVSQLQETKKSIAFEVKNDFFKYKKALLQLKSSLSQKHFREEELKITWQEALSGEAKFVHLMEILVQLADANNKYSNALGNYYIAIANLKKATGYGLHISVL